MNLAFTFLLVVTCFVATAKRSQYYEDDDDEVNETLDQLYSIEDDPPFPSRFISQKGDLRKTFALIAAIDNQNSNMICSPLSALLPLGKLAVGARDEASDELLNAIGVSRRRKLKSHFKSLIEDLKYIQDVQLDLASRIYLSKYLNLHRKFIDRSKYIFDSTAEKVDFGNPADAAYEINTWITKKTNGMIKDVVSPAEISQSTSLVLVNAIYFGGQWKVPFGKLKDGIFYTPRGEKKVKMMTRLGWYNYARSNILGAQLIEVPYEGDGASFVILLPFKRNGLPALLSQLKLAPDLLNSELSRMSKIKIMLTMPKFKMETTLDLVELYKKIGLKSIFKPNDSGLRKIVRDQTVYVSNAKQKAVIEVTELGTEAAVASVVQVIGASVDIHREKMNCEYPFLFLIVANKQQLFVGTLNDP